MELFKFNQQKINHIDAFMKQLLESETTAEKVEIFRKYEKDIEQITPLDMFYLFNYSNETELSIEEIKKTANKFINVFHKGLEKYSEQFHHPLLKELNKESSQMENLLIGLKDYYKSKEIKKYKTELLNAFNKCLEFETKFIKFENIIFPQLESRCPSTKPFEVLWSLHDDARQEVKLIIKLLESDKLDEQKIIERIGAYYYLIFGINQKEKLIILPLLEELLTEEKLNLLFNESLNYGFVFMETPKPIDIKDKIEVKEDIYSTISGSLSFQQLSLILNKIPIDITFVDKDDRVLYYNDRMERHFPRNPSVIGRLVKHCHPPKSVHVVEDIINDFKEKKRDTAEFWIDIKGVFLYITYYAIRDKLGEYQGVLEVSQDVTRIRSLQGEKRLL